MARTADVVATRTESVHPTFGETYNYTAYDGLQRLSGRQTVSGLLSEEMGGGLGSVKIKGLCLEATGVN
ncbi:MAG TPA: hypothetical protein VFY56_06725 [Propionibacteriaceae bacterium]|nr:hypothetical protein [Propionibacteriaceae bacterium]